MNEKLKEVRIYLCAAIIVSMFLPWAAVTISADVLGYEGAEQTAYTGLTMCQVRLFGALIYLIPLALIVIELVEQIHLDTKLFYLLGSVLGIVISVLGFLSLKGLMDNSYEDEYSSVSTQLSPKIGFCITVAAYLAIIVYTLIKDYALSKQAIQEKGIKGAITDIAGNVASDLSEQAEKVQSGVVTGPAEAKPTMPCPNCGAPVVVGKKFCVKCGNKLESAERLKERKAAAGNGMTVKQYLAKLKNITCEKCGATVPAGTKFCPDCGEQIVIMVTPEFCSCGAKLMDGRKFCPDCGAEVRKVQLQETCVKCGADLIYGKKFCVECGEKIKE